MTLMTSKVHVVFSILRLFYATYCNLVTSYVNRDFIVLYEVIHIFLSVCHITHGVIRPIKSIGRCSDESKRKDFVLSGNLFNLKSI